jgi:ABC-type multidrug transport system permease subunit
LRRYMRDRLAALMWLGIPLVIGSLMILATGGSEGPRIQAHVLVADEDDTFLSRLLLGAMGQGRAGDIIQAERVDQEAGRQRLDRGEATALLVIPKGFSEALLKEEPTRLLLVVNPAQRILPGIVEELLRMVADGAFYVHRLVGPELRAMATGPTGGRKTFSDVQIVRTAASINQTMRKLERYVFPPAIELRTTVDKPPSADAAPKLSPAMLFLPGILVMGLLFAAQGLSGDVWLERESGVLRRVVTTPLGIPRFLAGKLLAIASVLAVIALVVLAAGICYVGLPWSRMPLALLWSVAVGVMLTAMMLAVQVFASTRRGASLLTFAILMPMMMLGGCMFPLEAMPGWMAAVGRCMPNGWGIEHLKAILLGRDGPLGLPVGFALMAAVAAALLLLAGVRMSRVFARK